jgi:hypothetical protein
LADKLSLLGNEIGAQGAAGRQNPDRSIASWLRELEKLVEKVTM